MEYADCSKKNIHSWQTLRESLRWEGWIWSPAHHWATTEVRNQHFTDHFGRDYRLLQLTKSQNSKTSFWEGQSRGWEQRSEVVRVSLWMLGAIRRKGAHSTWEGLSSKLRWLMAAIHRSGRKSQPPAAYRTPAADPFLFVSHPPGLLLMMRSSFGRQFPHLPCFIQLRCLICQRWDPPPSWKYKTPKGGGISRPTHNPQTIWDTEGG